MQQMLHVFKQWTFPLNAQSYEALRLCSNMGLFHSANDEWGPTHNRLLRLSVCVETVHFIT